MFQPVVSRKESEILERRARVAEYYRDGMRLYEIAELLGVHRNTIWRDLQFVHQQYLERTASAHETRLIRELQALAYVENEATEAWERSKLDAESTQVTTEGEGGTDVKTVKMTKGQAGDPRFLDKITDCIKERAKLLGLYAPEKLDLGGGSGKEPAIDPDKFSDEQIEAYADLRRAIRSGTTSLN